MSPGASRRPPLSPREGWLSDGRHVLRFRPSRWESRVQRLEITTGELLPDQEIPLLKSRRELSRAEALKLWSEKRNAAPVRLAFTLPAVPVWGAGFPLPGGAERLPLLPFLAPARGAGGSGGLRAASRTARQGDGSGPAP